MSARISDRSDQSSRPAASNTQNLEKMMIKIGTGHRDVPEKNALYLATVPVNIDVGADIECVWAFFTKIKFTFLKSVWKDSFFDIPFVVLKKKLFHLLEGAWIRYFWELNGQKWKKPLNISKNSFL